MKTVLRFFHIGKNIWPLIRSVVKTFGELIDHNVDVFHIKLKNFNIITLQPSDSNGLVTLPVKVTFDIVFPSVDAAKIAVADPHLISIAINSALESRVPRSESEIDIDSKTPLTQDEHESQA